MTDAVRKLERASLHVMIAAPLDLVDVLRDALARSREAFDGALEALKSRSA